MRAHSRRRLSIAGLSVVAVALLATCSQRPSSFERSLTRDALERRLDAKHRAALHARLDGYFDAVNVAAEDEDPAPFNRATLALLQYSARVPIYWLVSYHQSFLERVDERGVETYLSYFVDYADRLSRFRTPSGKLKYKHLIEVVEKKPIVPGDQIAFLRVPSRRYFTAASENVVVAIAYLMLSDAGSAMRAHHRGSMRDYARVAALLGACEEKERIETADTLLAADRALRLRAGESHTCDILLEGLRSRLGDRSPSSLAGLEGAIDDMRRNGFRWSGEACVQSLAEDDPIADMVGRLEDYVSCRIGESGPDWSIGPHWISGYYSGYVTTPGLTYVPYRSETNCSNGECTTDDYYFLVDADGDYAGSRWTFTTATESTDHAHWFAVVDGQTVDYGVTTYRSDDENTITYSVSVKGVGGVSTTFDENANTKTIAITVVYSDGSSTTWTTVYDASGKVISDTETQNPPPPPPPPPPPSPDEDTQDAFEPEPDACAEAFHGRPTDVEESVTKLETQIIPGIDSPIGPTDDPCFDRGSPPLQRCVSVWLCVNGQVDANCRCKSTAGQPADTGFRFPCDQIMCDEGYTCDPASGACVSKGGGLIYQPGIDGGPPMPYGTRERLQSAIFVERIVRIANAVRSNRNADVAAMWGL